MLRIGDWCVNPTSCQISRDGETVRLEPRTMRLLLCLAKHAGEVVSIDELLDQIWPDVAVSPDSVYHAVASLRRLLGDDTKSPTYIATVPRLGYRLLARLSSSPDDGKEESANQAPGHPVVTAHSAPKSASDPVVVASGRKNGWRSRSLKAAYLVLGSALVFILQAKLAPHRTAHPEITQKSVAVLPFLDLTEGMKEEEFADGMTEEMIDRLSKLPDFRVPAPTASFYFKNKRVPIADIGKTLGVAYVVDGSVRKSGDRLRIAARLICANRGYVVWSRTYDRPWADVLTIQDDIACELIRALKASIDAESANHTPK
jgi:transcriptional activator of cad operon